MAEVVESIVRADSAERVEEGPQAVVITETAGPVGPSFVRSLMQRLGSLGGANRRDPTSRSSTPTVRGYSLQVAIDQVAAQQPEDSSEEGERCGVCARSFTGHVRARCPGCSKRIHKDGCVTYMALTTKLQAGMCNVCCNRVNEWMDEVREYTCPIQARFGKKMIG